MQNLTNIGVNLVAYVPPAMVLLIILVGYKLAKTLHKLSKVYDVDSDMAKQLTKSYIRQSIAIAICVAIAIFAGFFAYGPGKRVTTANYPESGWMKRAAELPDEKPLEVIQKEGEANKDKTGTLPSVASEEAFQKEGEEVDKEIDTILKRWDENVKKWDEKQ